MQALKLFFLILVTSLLAGQAHAQNFFGSDSMSKVEIYRTVVGTSTAAAIPAASIGKSLVSWKICNDAVNTSTYLLVGKAVDVSSDGVMLGKGACVECMQCKAGTLEAMKVEAQAASNGYTVIQYRK